MSFAEHQVKVQKLILAHLSRLADDLCQFEQTTHARVTLGHIADDLKKMYDDPTPYNISNFCQGMTHLND